MLVYNMDFLISSFIILLLLLYHFINQKKPLIINTKIFQMFILLGITDVAFDIISTIMISYGNEETAGLIMLTVTILYMLQVLVPYAFLCYIKSLRVESEKKMRKILKIWAIPAGIMELLVIGNIWSGIFFRVDASGQYIRGEFYLWMYYYVFVIVVFAAVDGIIHWKKLGVRKLAVICEFMIIAVICVAIQAWHNDLLMTGFGICLGIMVLYMTLHNPSGYTDNLTGIFDKMYFDRWLQNRMDKRTPINLVCVDIPHLRQVNKILGASFGDKMIVKIADMLQELSISKQVFRLSGKRFVLVTESLHEYEYCRDAIREFFSNSIPVDGEMEKCPAVICGILNAQELEESDTIQAYIEYLISLVRDADDCTLIQGDERTMQGFRYEQEVERFLDTAIEEDLFEVYYQPVFSRTEGHYVSMEALSRLRHPALGMVSPEVFITIAERRRCIDKIAELQLHRICRFVKANEEMMKTIQNVKINLSPLELLKTGHIQGLMDTIREYGLPYSYFQFEVTETVATEYSDALYEIVEKFQTEKIGLSLDDFGSGYANLNTVLKLPFSSVKIDRSMLTGICKEEKIALFYHNIVSLLVNMGYSVIAEGVEEEDEMILLCEWGVDMIQGYYFSRPLSENQIVEEIKI